MTCNGSRMNVLPHFAGPQIHILRPLPRPITRSMIMASENTAQSMDFLAKMSRAHCSQSPLHIHAPVSCCCKICSLDIVDRAPFSVAVSLSHTVLTSSFTFFWLLFKRQVYRRLSPYLEMDFAWARRCRRL